MRLSDKAANQLLDEAFVFGPARRAFGWALYDLIRDLCGETGVPLYASYYAAGVEVGPRVRIA